MTIDQMKMILCVAEVSSISQAAQQLFISQPALSKSIRAAERELGQALFERSKIGIQPTEFGKIFCETARSIVDSYEHIKELTVERLHWDFPTLRVSACPLRHAGWAFAQVAHKYALSAAELRFVSSSSSDCVNAVAKGESDVGIISVAVPVRDQVLAELDKVGITYQPLVQMDPLIVVSKESPLAQKTDQIVCLEDLKKMTLFSIYEELPVFEKMNEEILSILGLDTAQQTVYYDPRAGLSDLFRPNEFRCNLDGSYMYEKTGTRHTLLDAGKKFRLDPVPFRFEVGILQRKNAELNALAEEYISELQSVISKY